MYRTSSIGGEDDGAGSPADFRDASVEIHAGDRVDAWLVRFEILSQDEHDALAIGQPREKRGVERLAQWAGVAAGHVDQTNLRFERVRLGTALVRHRERLAVGRERGKQHEAREQVRAQSADAAGRQIDVEQADDALVGNLARDKDAASILGETPGAGHAEWKGNSPQLATLEIEEHRVGIQWRTAWLPGPSVPDHQELVGRRAVGEYKTRPVRDVTLVDLKCL